MTKQCRHRRAFFTARNAKAFTLVEVLLGIVVMSLMIAAVTSIFFNGVSLYQRCWVSVRVQHAIFKLFDQFDDDLGRLVLFDGRQMSPEWRNFKGNRREMLWPIRSPKGLKLVHYQWDDASPSDLIRKQSRLKDDFDHVQEVSWTKMAKSLDKEHGLDFSYASLDQNKLLWQEVWDREDIPVAVRLTVRFTQKDKRQGLMEFSRIFYIENR